MVKKAKPRSPKSRDFDLGMRIRAARLAANPPISQEALSGELGVSFQQVQKYEKGINRISAMRLIEIAKVLGTTPAALTDQKDNGLPKADNDSLTLIMTSNVGVRLAKAFAKLTGPQQISFANLAQEIAG